MSIDAEVIRLVESLLREVSWEGALRRVESDARLRDEPVGRAARDLFAAWVDAECGRFPEAESHLAAITSIAAMAPWSTACRAFIALRQKDFATSARLLDEAESLALPGDDLVRGTVVHLRAAAHHHRGEAGPARSRLLEFLRDYTQDHPSAGAALDTLGMIYAGRDDLYTARELYRCAIAAKARRQDAAGLAVSHGQLGRLYLDWGDWDQARSHFEEDLRVARRIGDDRGHCQVCNHLGQHALARGDQYDAIGQAEAARSAWEDAAGWLDSAIARAEVGPWPVIEGYARKDRALAHIRLGELDEAGHQSDRAAEVFLARGFDEGLAHVARAVGILRRAQGKMEESLASLRASQDYFDRAGEAPELARTLIEFALTLRASGEPRPLVAQVLREALATAESTRRDVLVARAERELMAVDPEAYRDRIYRRVRGLSVAEDTTSLVAGSRETATALYLDLKGSAEFARGRDPEVVMRTINQLMAELVAVLRRHDAQVSIFRGDGFLALVRGRDHAARAVATALEMFAAIGQFNEPRAVIGLPAFSARVGIASGEVFLGNVGTYDKMDYTALGTTANLGARIEAGAREGLPCISEGTRDLVDGRFTYTADSPREIEAKGLGRRRVWDVVGESGGIADGALPAAGPSH